MVDKDGRTSSPVKGKLRIIFFLQIKQKSQGHFKCLCDFVPEVFLHSSILGSFMSF